MLKLAAIALGGALGSLLRYAASGAVYRYAGGTFPWGTLAVNLAGSLAIGFLWALFEAVTVSPNVRSFLLVGVLGGFTTFSTFTAETFNLLRDGEIALGLWNIVLSNVTGILMVFAGFVVFRALFR